jgi:aminoglycoside 3-N-acetyltransferase
MPLENLIDSTPSPATVDSLKKDLSDLGIQPGMVLLVHSSLSSLGWVNGGAVAVILALEEILGSHGTLVMPTHSGDLSDPGEWEAPPIPKDWWDTVRSSMPAYEASLTPTSMMGKIPETFRKQTGVLRSNHPQVSFAAWGAQAESITANHALNYSLGEDSPLARIYELGGSVLLLGVDHSNNTSLHRAEYRAEYPTKKTTRNGAPILVDQQRQWVEIVDINLDSDDFLQIGEAFSSNAGQEKQGQVAMASARLMSQKALVDYGVVWMEKNRA